MRILLVSFEFPPHPGIGSLRLSKTAKYLTRHGHDVRVLSAAGPLGANALPLEVPEGRVTYARWLGSAQRDYVTDGHGERRAPSAISRAIRLASPLVAIPDTRIGWFPFAVSAGSALLQRWRPDVILASGPPFTSLVVGATLARRFAIPWIAELRDLWAENHYLVRSRWRERLDHTLERSVLKTAAGFVTVSDPWAAWLRRKYSRETVVVTNGFDPCDLPAVEVPRRREGPLSIGHFGEIYEGRRDPTVLFRAIASLGWSRADVVVRFHGPNLRPIAEIARREGVEDLVDLQPLVPHVEALRLQQETDLLLLLLWNHPAEHGVIPGKLFEYIGARRPIVAIGPDDNVALSHVRDLRLGFAGTCSHGLADYLAGVHRRRVAGTFGHIPADVTRAFTRERQTARLEDFLGSLGAQRRVYSNGTSASSYSAP